MVNLHVLLLIINIAKCQRERKKNDKDLKVIAAEFNVSMHCNACERSVAKVLSKLKGVEKFVTDMNKHRVTVTGKINPQKVLKKLRKKTGKRVEIVVEKPKEAADEGKNLAPKPKDIHPPFFDCCKNSEVLLMFSDENPNACRIM